MWKEIVEVSDANYRKIVFCISWYFRDYFVWYMMQVRGRNVEEKFEKLQGNETPLGMMSVWEASTSVAVNQKIVEN